MLRSFYLVLFMAALAVQSFGQWVVQRVDLQPGWNAVHLAVQPVPGSCSELFRGLPVERIAWWSRQTGQAEFDSDPMQTFPRSANWRNWYADDSKANTFGGLLSGKSYIVFANTAFSMDIKGVPRLGRGDWLAGEPVFTGLPVPAGNTLSFNHFFGFTDKIDAVDSGDVFRVGHSGAYQSVFRPALEAVQPGTAYWIQAGEHNSSYYGPINVRLQSASDSLDFSGSFTPRRLEIENATDSIRSVTISHIDSEPPPPDGGFPAVAGKVPLGIAQLDLTGYAPVENYLPLPDVLITNIPAGESIVFKLLPTGSQGGGLGAGEAWQSVLQVTDEYNDGESEATVRHRVGVFWDGEEADHTGLWVGSVAVTHVNRAQTQMGVSNLWDHTEPVPVVRPYTFRVLVHLGNDGKVHLLQRVLPAWIPDGEIVATNDGYETNAVVELFTDEHYAELCLAEHPEARISRISSVNFPLMAPVLMDGGFGGTGALDCTVELLFNDSVNPFAHRYHPMHDNKEYNNDGSATPLGEGDESTTVTRALRFAFAGSDPERGAGNPQWGVSEMGGTFTETVNGLNKTIYVQGPFRLEKVNDCGALKYLDQ